VRHGWPAEQCLWLGPDRHRRRRGDTVTNAEPESYANSNCHAFGMRTDGNTITVVNCNANTNADGYCDGDGDGDGNTHSDCYAHFHRNGYG
jgi:hypothetical protein